LCLGPPEITYITPDMTYLEGREVRLICNVTNDGDAVNQTKIVWYHKSLTSFYQVVPNNQHVHIMINSNARQSHSILLFDPVNRTDEGEYVCKASNHLLSYTESSTKVLITSK